MSVIAVIIFETHEDDDGDMVTSSQIISQYEPEALVDLLKQQVDGLLDEFNQPADPRFEDVS
jgi:hypothetical protein